MIKTKDGYAKLIGTTYSGSISRVLLSNGGDHVLGNSNGNIPLNNGTVNTNLNADMLDGLHIHTGRNNEVNKIVRTDANGHIQAGWINTTSGDIGTGAINKIYCSNDDYIRYKTPANFFETLSNDGNQISITVGSQNRKLTVNYASFTKTLDKVSLPSSTSNAANTAWCKFARITFNNSAWSVASGYLFFGGSENPDNRAILVYHFRSGNTATTLSTANLYWLIKSYSNATVIAVKVADNVYDLYINNSGTYMSPCIYHMSAFSSRFTWSIGNWTTTKPTAAYTSSDIGRVNYANSTGNADTLDNYHANGLLTALSNSNNGVSITVGGTTKSISNISVNYASSAGSASSATKVIVNQHTTNDINYPLVWSNQANSNTITENQLFKSWLDLYYNPKNKRLTVGGSVVASSFVKSNGTSQQLLRADGEIATFNWSGQSGQPTWLWGGNNQHSYYVYNPSNFRVAYASSSGNADTVDGYHASSFLIDKGHDYKGLIYDLPCKSIFSGNNLSDAPTTGWVSGIVLGSNWNSSHYQHYLVEIGSRWYATRNSSDGKMTNWNTFAYLTDNVASASKWATARTITLSGSVTGSVSIDGSKNVTLTTTTSHTHNWANIEGKPSTFTPSAHTHSYITIPTCLSLDENSNNFSVEYAGGNNSVATKPSGVDAFGVMRLRTAGGWYGQILMSTNTAPGIYYRNANGLTSSIGWIKLLDSNNSSVSGGGNAWGSSITVKINGTSKTLTIPGNPNTDYRVTQSETTTANYRPLILGYTNVSTAGSGMTGSVTNQVYLSNKFYVQPNTGNLYATTFVGALSGNASTASKWATARKITLTGSITGEVSIDGSKNVTLATTTNHTHSYAGSPSAGGAANSANVLNSNSRMDYGWNGLNYFNASLTAGCVAKTNDSPTSAWWHIMRFNHANNNGYYTDLAIPFEKNSLYWKCIRNGSLANTTWVKVLDSLNYNEYAPTKTGGGASGTWGISISGNAATATTLQTTRTLWGQSFNGSANVSGNMSNVGQITFSALSGTNGRALLYQQMADNDFFRIYVGGTASDAGYAEIATADGGNEPIYVRQYTGTFSTLKRTLTLLDTKGNTTFPGTASSSGFIKSGSNNDYILLGGGGHKAISDFSTSGHTHDGRYMRVYLESDVAPTSTNGYWSAMTTQSGISGDWWHIIHTAWNDAASWRSELALPTQGRNGVRYRSDSNGGSGWTFGSWVKLLDENNWSNYCAAKSHIHSYLPLSGGTLTGALTIKNNSWNNILILNRTSASGTWGPSIIFQYDGTTNGTLTMTSNQLYIGDNGSNRHKAWHEGNDGSGSGLDADKIDGYHASSFALSGHTHSYLPLAGGTMTGQIQKAGVSSNWINGRKNAMIRMNSIDGYSAFASIKTTNGSWEIGTYNYSSHLENLIFSYCADTDFNNGTNNIKTQIRFYNNGTIGASITGNAATANKWAAARTLTLSGSVTGSVSIDGSGNVTLATTTNHTHTFASLTSKPTTISGYGITDAKIANGVITLGTTTIKPLTTHQTVTLASGTNKGTLKLTVNGTATDNIAVKGLGSAAYTASSTYSAANHTHSVIINGVTKTISATGGTAVNLGTYLTAHQSVSNKAVTLAWGTSSTIATIGSTDITVTLPTILNIDTKNTAGSTDTSSKIFLIGATSQAANPQTYSHDTAYVGADGCLYSGSKKVSVNGHTHSYLPLAGGTMNANARIAQESSNLYIGTSTSTGWVYLQDMASQKGADYWAIAQDGGAYFKQTVTASTFIGELNGNATTATNADTLDGNHASAFALQSAHNDLIASGNEFTFVPSGFNNSVYFNYRTKGGTNGNITSYIFGNGKGGALGIALHTGNYTSYCAPASHTHAYLPLSGGTVSGDIHANHFYENSDIRYKRILKNLLINSNTIANLPLFDFEWIENNAIGTGTSAQAVQKILPNIVSGTDKLTLDYGVLGTIAGITACKELVKVNIEIFTQKSELQQLKEKVKQLEDKLRKYENI